MPIIGLTDRDQRLPIIGTLRKGAPKPTNGNRPGNDLDHFRFVTDDPDVRADFKTAYGDIPRSIRVLLPHPTADENFTAWIEAWAKSGLLYRSDGETVVLHLTGKGYSTKPKPDPKPDEDEDGKRIDGSSYVGRLSLIIPELKRLALVTALTGSKNDILNLTQNLRAYEAIIGDLRKAPFILQRVLKEISTPAPKGKEGRIRRKKWLLALTLDPQWQAERLEATAKLALASSVPDEAVIVEANDDAYYIPAEELDEPNPFDDEPPPPPVDLAEPEPPPEPDVPADIPTSPKAALTYINRKVEQPFDKLADLLTVCRELTQTPTWTWPTGREKERWYKMTQAVIAYRMMGVDVPPPLFDPVKEDILY
jgi:hypothetical protein